MSRSEQKKGRKGAATNNKLKPYLNVAKNVMLEGKISSLEKFKNIIKSARKNKNISHEEVLVLLDGLLKLSLRHSSDPRFYAQAISEEFANLCPDFAPGNAEVIPLFVSPEIRKSESKGEGPSLKHTISFYLSIMLNFPGKMRASFEQAEKYEEMPPLITALRCDAIESFKHLMSIYRRDEETLVKNLLEQKIRLNPTKLSEKIMLLPLTPGYVGHIPSIHMGAFQYAIHTGKAILLQDTLSNMSKESLSVLFGFVPEHLKKSHMYLNALAIASLKDYVYCMSLMKMLDSIIVRGSGGSLTALDVALENSEGIFYYLAVGGNTPTISLLYEKLGQLRTSNLLFVEIDGEKRNIISLLFEKGLVSQAQVAYIQLYMDATLRKKMLLEDSPLFYVVASKTGSISREETAFINFLLAEAVRLNVLEELLMMKKVVGKSEVVLHRHLENVLGMPLNKYILKHNIIKEPYLKPIALSNEDR